MSEPSLESRVLALETSNRRLIAAVLALATLLFVIFTLALAARAEADACDRAAALQRIELLDAEGTAAGVLVVEDGVGRLVRSAE